MSRHRLARSLAAPLVAAALVMAAPAGAARADDASGSDQGDPGKFLLMLDSSGSMNGKDPSGVTKLAAAQKALSQAVDTLPAKAQVGLRVYGATVDVPKPTTASCHDTQLVAPVTTRDLAVLKKAIAGFTAKGDTPMAYALTEGIKDLGTSGPRHIILVSDGQENCTKDPCPEVSKAIASSGVDLQIDTVGFGVDEPTRRQLKCVADAGRGTYYDAADAGQLGSALSRLSTRAARSFSVRGTPVVGTATADAAPTITAGQYTDTVRTDPNAEVHRWYRIHRKVAGSTIRATMLGRLPLDMGDVRQVPYWKTRLTTPDGQVCAERSDWDSDPFQFGRVTTMTSVVRAINPANSQDDTEKKCAAASDLLFEIDVSKGKALSLAAQLRVLEEPLASNVAQLPAGIADPSNGNGTSPATGHETYRPVVGGSSFDDALTIEPGNYVTEVVPGEKIFFAMPLDWGQSATFSMEGPDPNHPAIRKMANDYLAFAGDVYAPDLSQMDSQDFERAKVYSGLYKKLSSADVNQVPTIRYRNLWDSKRMYNNASIGFSMAGRYYFTVGVGQGDYGASIKGVPIPVRFIVTRSGQVTGKPVFAGAPTAAGGGTSASASASTSTTATSTSTPAAPSAPTGSHRGLLVGLLGVPAVLIVGGVAWWVVRRRRKG